MLLTLLVPAAAVTFGVSRGPAIGGHVEVNGGSASISEAVVGNGLALHLSTLPAGETSNSVCATTVSNGSFEVSKDVVPVSVGDGTDCSGNAVVRGDMTIHQNNVPAPYTFSVRVTNNVIGTPSQPHRLRCDKDHPPATGIAHSNTVYQAGAAQGECSTLGTM